MVYTRHAEKLGWLGIGDPVLVEAVGAAQCADWQEEASGRSDPSGAIQSNAASRNNVLDVRMMLEKFTVDFPDLCL